MELLKISQIFQHIMVGIAVVIGGLWSYYQWRTQRTHETALEIDLVTSCSPFGNDLFFVFIDVSLKNIGRRRLGAKSRDHRATKPVYEDFMETLHYSLGLQVRSVKKEIKGSHAIDWFELNDLATPDNIPDELNLLREYEISEGKKEDMWIEPGETSHFGCAMILPAGHYLAKVTFVGTRGEIDFWRRLFYICIPA